MISETVELKEEGLGFDNLASFEESEPFKNVETFSFFEPIWKEFQENRRYLEAFRSSLNEAKTQVNRFWGNLFEHFIKQIEFLAEDLSPVSFEEGITL